MAKVKPWGLALLTAWTLAAAAARADNRALSSGCLGTGCSWSDPNSWVPAGVPGPDDDLDIPVSRRVNLDVAAATARSIALYGTLYFSRTSSSTLTMTGGDITVQNGGVLDMGTSVSSITASCKATLVLARGADPAQYGLIIINGGKFFAHGASKTPATFALADPSAAGVDVPAADAQSWELGDTVTIGQTESVDPFVNQTEERVITGLSTTGSTTTVTLR